MVYGELHSARTCRRLDRRAGGGTYRLRRRDDEALFGYNVGPHSWKQYAVPPTLRLFEARARATRPERRSARTAAHRRATRFIGVRSCELHAIAIQDRVLPRRPHVGPRLRARRREDAFIVAVNCAQAGGTCFCASMDTGPAGASAGFDLALTEMLDGGRHRFLVGGRAASAAPRCWPRCRTRRRRAELRARRGSVAAAPPRRWAASSTPTASRSCCTQPRAPALGRGRRALPDLRQLHAGLPDLLLHHASRTSTDLTGERRRAHRRWDSCFTVGPLLHPRRQRAASTRSRYRQWMTHKLGDLDRPVRQLRLRRLRTLHHLVPGRHRHHRGGGGDPRTDSRAGGGRCGD